MNALEFLMILASKHRFQHYSFDIFCCDLNTMISNHKMQTNQHFVKKMNTMFVKHQLFTFCLVRYQNQMFDLNSLLIDCVKTCIAYKKKTQMSFFDNFETCINETNFSYFYIILKCDFFEF